MKRRKTTISALDDSFGVKVRHLQTVQVGPGWPLEADFGGSHGQVGTALVWPPSCRGWERPYAPVVDLVRVIHLLDHAWILHTLRRLAARSTPADPPGIKKKKEGVANERT
jgi:hypothetical protein